LQRLIDYGTVQGVGRSGMSGRWCRKFFQTVCRTTVLSTSTLVLARLDAEPRDVVVLSQRPELGKADRLVPERALATMPCTVPTSEVWTPSMDRPALVLNDKR
jgi:hypothetical protein